MQLCPLLSEHFAMVGWSSVGFGSTNQDPCPELATPGWTTEADGAGPVSVEAIVNVAGPDKCSTNTGADICPAWLGTAAPGPVVTKPTVTGDTDQPTTAPGVTQAPTSAPGVTDQPTTAGNIP